MPIPDDDLQFEAQLKNFTPRAAPPLASPGATGLHKITWMTAAAKMAAAALLLVVFAGALFWYVHRHAGLSARGYPEIGSAGVTLGRAEAALAQDSSFDDTIDRLERASKPLQKSKPANHTQKALQVLGREELL